VVKTIKKTLKLKLIPLTRSDRTLLLLLLKDYTSMVREALSTILRNDVRSRKRAHEICYKVLRERYPHMHNKFAEEAYRRALGVYRSYRKLLNKWRRSSKKRRDISPPSLPTIKNNRVIELHIDTYSLESRHGFLTLRISKGSGIYLRFLVMKHEHAEKELEDARVGNSKILVDGDDIYLLLTVRKDSEISEHRNKLVIDINEDSVDGLLVDYESSRATLFSIGHDIRAIRTNYRRIKKGIQMKVKDLRLQRSLLTRYGARERHRVEDRLKKITTLLAEISKQHNADLIREDLKDLKLNKKRSKQLNYRLSTFPYHKFISYIDYKFWERKLSVIEVNANKTSITCPVCGYTDKRNRVDKETFRCGKCGFTFNAQYVACLNLYSRLNDGVIAIRGGRLMIITREAGPVVPVDVVPDEAPSLNEVLRGKPMFRVTQVAGGI